MEDQSTILDQEVSEHRTNRRKLLPWWIKVFCWIFMATGAVGIIGYGGAVIFGFAFPISVYGLQTSQPVSLMGLLLTSIFVLKGIAAFALWTEKDWAIAVGLIDGVLGIVLCFVVMIVIPAMTGVGNSFRLETIFLAFYVGKLVRLRPAWNWN